MLLWNRLFWGPIFPLLWNGVKHCHCPGVAKKANTRYMSRLRQLQEHFYEISDNKESGDWNVHRKYCAVRTKHVSKEFPLDNVHMMKANSTSLVKVESVTCIKPPDGKHTKGVV